MIVLGVILLVVGYYLVPKFVPDVPPVLDHLAIILGWIFLVVGLILLFLGMFRDRSIGGRRYWY